LVWMLVANGVCVVLCWCSDLQHFGDDESAPFDCVQALAFIGLKVGFRVC